jgi:acetyltransferase-like isoleucine patch superfamily enzyme
MGRDPAAGPDGSRPDRGPVIRDARVSTLLQRASRRLRRAVEDPVVTAIVRAQGVSVAPRVQFLGRPIISLAPESAIAVASSALLISRPSRTALGVSSPVILRTLLPGASIEIGPDTGMSGTTVCAALSVLIGARVLLGADVMISDTDFHPVDEVPRRHGAIPLPESGDGVIIEDDVFIGARSIILRGVRVGHGSVVGAGSVVTSDVAPLTVVAGSPARYVRDVG